MGRLRELLQQPRRQPGRVQLVEHRDAVAVGAHHDAERGQCHRRAHLLVNRSQTQTFSRFGADTDIAIWRRQGSLDVVCAVVPGRVSLATAAVVSFASQSHASLAKPRALMTCCISCRTESPRSRPDRAEQIEKMVLHTQIVALRCRDPSNVQPKPRHPGRPADPAHEPRCNGSRLRTGIERNPPASIPSARTRPRRAAAEAAGSAPAAPHCRPPGRAACRPAAPPARRRRRCSSGLRARRLITHRLTLHNQPVLASRLPLEDAAMDAALRPLE